MHTPRVTRRCGRRHACWLMAWLVTAGLAFAAVAADKALAAPAPAILTQEQVSADGMSLNAFVAQLREQESSMYRLRRTVRADERGHFTGDETEAIQLVLFHYLVCREALWDMVNRYGAQKDLYRQGTLGPQAFLVALRAAVWLQYGSSKLVAVSMDNGEVVRKLNEAMVPYGVPAGTYDRLLAAVTKVSNLERLEVAYGLYAQETRQPTSPMTRLLASAPDCAQIAAEIDATFTNARFQTEYILLKRSLLLPKTENVLRQSFLAGMIDASGKLLVDNLEGARAVLFTGVGDAKAPLTRQAFFLPQQRRAIKDAMQPGDVILTFSAGYMSNIFLPGKFKHGLTYVGSVEQRRAAGLTPELFADVPEAKRALVLKALDTETLPDGEPADVVEAISEGVVFSSIEELLKTHYYRIAVLRPKLTAAERAGQLKTTFLLLGAPYDFHFDFDDATDQCCTEVIYRSLLKRGVYDFPLVNRMGIQTLSADDLLAYQLGSQPAPFAFVLFGEANSADSSAPAVIRTGDDSEKRLRELMKEDKSPLGFSFPSLHLPGLGK